MSVYKIGSNILRLSGGGGVLSTDGAPPPAGETLAALNLWTPSYFYSVFPFIDIMRNAVTNWSGTGAGAQNANYWLTSLGAGQTASTSIILDLDPLYGYVPSGDYVMTTSSGATLSVSAGTGITNIVPGVNRATFTLTQNSGITLTVNVNNATGSPINVSDVKVFLASNEDLIDAGEEFDPVFLATIDNAAILRFMDWAGTNNSSLRTTADLPSDAKRGFISYECMARLGKKTGKQIWIPMPYVSDNLFCSFNGTTNICTAINRDSLSAQNHGWAANDEVMFYGTSGASLPTGLSIGVRYYVRNPSGTTFQLATTSGGTPIDFTGDLSGGGDTFVRVTKIYDPVPLFDEIARRVWQTYPECPMVWMEPGNENWNTGFDHYDNIREVWSFRAGLGSGTNEGAGLFALRTWEAWENYYPRAQCKRVVGGQTDNFALTSIQFGYVDPGIIDTGETLGNLVDAYVVAPYVSPRDGATDLSAGGGPGPLLALGADTATDAQWDDWFDQGIAHVSGVVAQILLDIAGIRADIEVTTYECGQHIFSTNGRDDDLHLRIIAYLDSAAGAAMYARYEEDCFAAHGLTHMNHYVSTGGYFSQPSTHMGQWGLKYASHVADNPRSTWFASLPGQQDSGVGNVLTTTRLMVSGHSLSSRPDEGLGGPIASSLGQNYDWQKQTAAGSTMRYRTGDSPTFSGFQLGDSSTGTNDIDYLDEWTTPTAVSGGQYTHLLVTERHDLLLTLQYEGTLRHLKLYYDSFMVRSAGARVYLWSCWLTDAVITGANFESWKDYCLIQQKVWDAITARVNLTLINQGAQHRMHNAPMMYILVRMIETALAGDAPGISQVDPDDTLFLFFNGDGVHIDGPIGHYLFAIVEHMVVYRTSPVGAYYPTSGTWPGGVSAALTATQANTVQTLAWQYFQEYHQRDEWHPTMAEARDYVANVAVPSYNSYITGGGASASYFSAANYDDLNPFYFDAATDESLAGWFPVQ